jgi:Domain of unknown function (DUF5667)
MGKKPSDRAEILDDSLRRIQEGSATVEDCLWLHLEYPNSGELRSLLETACLVQERLSPRSSSQFFKRASEARLLQRIRAIRPARKEPRPVRQPLGNGMWLRQSLALFALAVFLAAGWGLIANSAKAIPGDSLYSLKLDLEQLQVAFSLTPEGDVSLLAQFVENRLEEIQEVTRKFRTSEIIPGLERYQQALGRLDSALEQLPPTFHSEQLEEIQGRLSRQTDVLLDLREQMPPEAQSVLDQTVERSHQSQKLIQDLREERAPMTQPSGKGKTATAGSGEATATIQPSSTAQGQNNATETSTPTNTNEPSATPTPTGTPSETPTPTSTTEPSPTPTPTGTSEPSKTPQPTSTTEPSKTPKPSNTPKSSRTPKLATAESSTS